MASGMDFWNRLTSMLLPIAVLAAGCSSTHEGWGRGDATEIHESPTLQIRRSAHKIDPQSGDLLIAWVGVRAPAGAPDIESGELTLYEDRNGNKFPDAGEAFDVRSSHQSCRKVLFDTLRVASESLQGRPRAWITVHTKHESYEHGWRLVPDR